jgi:FeoB-associated Cys-rich membrane protein
MGISDGIWMGLIIAGAFYLLYRSVWKKKGHCAGCSSGSCTMGKGLKQDNCR